MRSRTLAGERTASWPSISAEPSSARVSVVSTRTAVLLPAPFGPSSPWMVPVADFEVEAVERLHRSIPLAQAARGDGGSRHSSPFAVQRTD